MPLKKRINHFTSPLKKGIIIAASVLVVALALLLGAYFFIKPGPRSVEIPNKSIAVLPFDDLSTTHDQAYFGIGMMDEILSHLTKIADLSPVSGTTSVIYQNSGKPLKQIANELSVVYLLTGTVEKLGTYYKISVQLVDANNDRRKWVERYQAQADDIFTIQSDIAQRVAKILGARIDPEVKRRIETITTRNQDAYDLFLQAHSKLTTEEDVAPLLERVIRLDSNFSRAYSDLAFRWLLKGYWAGGESPQFVRNKMERLLQKAISLDSNNSDAYWVRSSFNLYFKWDIKSSLADLHTAEKLSPSKADFGHQFQVTLCADGKFDESLRKSLFYFNLDRNIPSNWVGLGNSYYYAGQNKKALEVLESAIKFLNAKYLSNEHEAEMELGQLKIFEKDWAGAINILKPMSQAGYPLFNGYIGIANAHLGQKSEALARLKILCMQSEQSALGSPAYFAAAVYVALGEDDLAIRWLEVAYQHHEVEMFWLKVTPLFDPIRQDSRFIGILRRIDL